MSAIADDQVPRLLRGVRVKHDRVRDRLVLLAPERVLKLDEIGAAILAETDGRRTLAEIVPRLARSFDAPPQRIAADVRAFFGALIDRRMAEAR